MEGFWLSCLSRFEKELPAQQFNTWIRPLKVDPAEPPLGEVRLRAPNRFVLQWVKERFAQRIEAMAIEYFASPVKLTLTLEPSNNPVLAEVPPAANFNPRPNPSPRRVVGFCADRPRHPVTQVVRRFVRLAMEAPQ